MENRYMNAKEASTYLGLPIMELYRLSSSSVILSYKFGGRLLYRKDELEKLVLGQEGDELQDQNLGQVA